MLIDPSLSLDIFIFQMKTKKKKNVENRIQLRKSGHINLLSVILNRMSKQNDDPISKKKIVNQFQNAILLMLCHTQQLFHCHVQRQRREKTIIFKKIFIILLPIAIKDNKSDFFF